MNSTTLTIAVTAVQAGFRADRALCALVEDLNRRTAKLFFHERLVRLNGKIASGSERVSAGDLFELPDPKSQAADSPVAEVQRKASAPRLTTAHGRHLVRLYEDDDVLVISKPPEIPVHRGQGGFTRRDTLEDVLERAYPPPPGAAPGDQGYYFVHRLDMETSGCLLIAKNNEARDKLIRDFSERKIHKEYIAVVVGQVDWKRLVVKNPINYVRAAEPEPVHTRSWEHRRPEHRERGAPMRGLKKGVALPEDSTEGKACETHLHVIARYRGYTVLRAEPKTGRTHQIRVHVTSTGHPLAYDPLYGRRSPLRYRELDTFSSESELGESIVLNRLPLHAWKLGFRHPKTEEFMSIEAPLARDIKEFIKLLKKFRADT
jgi:23S rRNA pseudouridine1911/1915/1917 synthase